jgi:single-strand DNA-binding protein
MNVVVLKGMLSRPAERRVLPSGTTVVAYEVTTRNAEGQAATVPVAWPDAPAGAELEQGDEVVVTGRVARRYFRAGGATQSRTEVVADAVVPASARRKAAAAVERASRALTGWTGERAAPADRRRRRRVLEADARSRRAG